MNHTQNTTADQTADESIRVEFYPSVDDYIYVAQHLAQVASTNTITAYAFYVFLFLNSIVFPVYLWLNGYFLTGFLVFIINLAAFALMVPRANSAGYRKFYEQLFAN